MEGRAPARPLAVADRSASRTGGSPLQEKGTLTSRLGVTLQLFSERSPSKSLSDLHSYRYAWAQRARAAGMPEREAMNHLGHESRAIHAAYAGGATVATLPLEFYEAQKRENVVQFTTAA